MKQIIADYIDQLDLALDQLAYNDRNFDRFALMLIDNVMELFLYQYAKDYNGKISMWNRIDDEAYDQKIVKKAVGKFFNDKVKLAVETNFLTPDVGETIKYLHNFRNSAYHEGLRHESILHSLTLFYFKITCEIISLYKPGYWMVSSSDKISHRAMKYLGKDEFPFSGESWLNAFIRLGEVAGIYEEDMKADLCGDLEETIETIDDYITFLSEDSSNQMTRLDAIIEYQAWYYAFTDEAKNFTKDKIDDKSISIDEYVQWLKANYSKIHRVDPINSWRRVLDKLSKEEDYKKALKIYCDFLGETDKLREIITDAAHKLDMHIQNQIDIMRGK